VSAVSQTVRAPATVRVGPIFGALMLVMLLASLDSTIVSTALPTIVGSLGGIEKLSWVCWYPFVYWLLCVPLVVRGTLPGLVRMPKLSVWNIPREQAEPGGAAALG
jgi:hypothetical protein